MLRIWRFPSLGCFSLGFFKRLLGTRVIYACKGSIIFENVLMGIAEQITKKIWVFITKVINSRKLILKPVFRILWPGRFACNVLYDCFGRNETVFKNGPSKICGIQSLKDFIFSMLEHFFLESSASLCMGSGWEFWKVIVGRGGQDVLVKMGGCL